MADPSLDDLIDKMFPHMQANGGGAQVQQQSSFDDPSPEKKPAAVTTSAATKPQPTAQPQRALTAAATTASLPAATAATTTASGGASPSARADEFDDDDDGDATNVARPAVPWPTIPGRITATCTPNTAALTNYASNAAIAEQQRLLHLPPHMNNDAKRCAPSAPGRDDDTGRWCPYVRCRKCDHVVVRLQHAYWTGHKFAKPPTTSSSPATPTPALSSSGNEKPAVAGGETAKPSHDWDESDDEVASPKATAPPQQQQQPTTAAGGSGTAPPPGKVAVPLSPDDMYLLTRYHYPDWGAFPAGVLRRLTETEATKTAAAAYLCQCSWVSVVEPRVCLDAGPPGAVPQPVPVQASGSIMTPRPFSSAVVHWVCKGHFAM